VAKTATFDRQEVIDKATNLYWKKGFHATSMRNLQDAVDLRPGSIYSAFGNKDGLFKEALANYADMSLAVLQQCQDEHNSPLNALKAFMKLAVVESQNSAPNGICMLSKTIAELTDDNQDLIDETKTHLASIASAFVMLIKEAQVLGEIDQDKNAEDLATHIQIQITGLRTFAKINNDKTKVNAMIDDIFTHYPF